MWFHKPNVWVYKCLPIASIILYQECWNQVSGLLDLGLMNYWAPEQSQIWRATFKKKKNTLFILPFFCLQKLIIRLVTFPKGPNTCTENTKTYFQFSLNPDYCTCLTWTRVPLKWIFSPIQWTLGMILSITIPFLPVNVEWPCQSGWKSAFHPRLNKEEQSGNSNYLPERRVHKNPSQQKIACKPLQWKDKL